MDKLKRQDALIGSREAFLRESRKTLAVELHLTALNAKTEPEGELIAEFTRQFADEPHEAIQWAFRAWRDKSPFFPALCEISELIKTWHWARYQETVAAKARKEHRDIEAARNRGELVNFTDLAKKLQDVANKKKMP